jgi:hypothetical protein
MYHQFNILQLYVLPTHTVPTRFVWIWEQTAINFPYSINWQVSVRLILLFKAQWSLYVQKFNIQHFYVLSTLCICVFCVDLRKNGAYFSIQH